MLVVVGSGRPGSVLATKGDAALDDGSRKTLAVQPETSTIVSRYGKCVGLKTKQRYVDVEAHAEFLNSRE